ncbi:MAG: hypothetical protein H8F28_02030 [Fibrella sp.]|nr:hypothetical protein [Armatimonadota bacterium]
MIVEGNDYEMKYLEERDGFRCEITGRNHADRGSGWGPTQDEAFDIAFADYRANRENREDDFVEKTRTEVFDVTKTEVSNVK